MIHGNPIRLKSVASTTLLISNMFPMVPGGNPKTANVPRRIPGPPKAHQETRHPPKKPHHLPKVMEMVPPRSRGPPFWGSKRGWTSLLGFFGSHVAPQCPRVDFWKIWGFIFVHHLESKNRVILVLVFGMFSKCFLECFWMGRPRALPQGTLNAQSPASRRSASKHLWRPRALFITPWDLPKPLL